MVECPSRMICSRLALLMGLACLVVILASWGWLQESTLKWSQLKDLYWLIFNPFWSVSCTFEFQNAASPTTNFGGILWQSFGAIEIHVQSVLEIWGVIKLFPCKYTSKEGLERMQMEVLTWSNIISFDHWLLHIHEIMTVLSDCVLLCLWVPKESPWITNCFRLGTF